MRKLVHPNIVTIQNVHFKSKIDFNDLKYQENTKPCVYFEMERAYRDLFWFKLNDYRLEPSAIKQIMLQVCKGVRYLHVEKELVHRDIKLHNVLLFPGGHVKITDFNHAIEASNLAETDKRNLCGTEWFKAPEMSFDFPYMYSVDIWALGCFFETLLTNDFIFKFESKKGNENEKRRQNLIPIVERLGVPTNETWPGIESQKLYDEQLTTKKVSQVDQETMLPNSENRIDRAKYSTYREYMDLKGVSDPLAINLLEKMLVMNPQNRITI